MFPLLRAQRSVFKQINILITKRHVIILQVSDGIFKPQDKIRRIGPMKFPEGSNMIGSHGAHFGTERALATYSGR